MDFSKGYEHAIMSWLKQEMGDKFIPPTSINTYDGEGSLHVIFSANLEVTIDSDAALINWRIVIKEKQWEWASCPYSANILRTFPVEYFN